MIFIIILILVIIFIIYNSKENFNNMNLIEPNVKNYDIQNKFNPEGEMNMMNNELNDIANQYERVYKIKPNSTSNSNFRLTKEQQDKDNENYVKNNLRLNNINKFANFETEVVNQNSNMFETEVDKFAQMRTDETFDVSKYGDTIWQAYDNLVKNPFSKYQTTTNPNFIDGSNKNTLNNNYQKLDTVNYRVDNLIQ